MKKYLLVLMALVSFAAQFAMAEYKLHNAYIETRHPITKRASATQQEERDDRFTYEYGYAFNIIPGLTVVLIEYDDQTLVQRITRIPATLRTLDSGINWKVLLDEKAYFNLLNLSGVKISDIFNSKYVGPIAGAGIIANLGGFLVVNESNVVITDFEQILVGAAGVKLARRDLVLVPDAKSGLEELEIEVEYKTSAGEVDGSWIPYGQIMNRTLN